MSAEIFTSFHSKRAAVKIARRMIDRAAFLSLHYFLFLILLCEFSLAALAVIKRARTELRQIVLDFFYRSMPVRDY
jgi:hypothetical protein